MEMWTLHNADDGLLVLSAIVIIGFMVGYPVVTGAIYLIKKWRNNGN
jgi:hypothetical protein